MEISIGSAMESNSMLPGWHRKIELVTACALSKRNFLTLGCTDVHAIHESSSAATDMGDYIISI
jgi:hypothetical protein